MTNLPEKQSPGKAEHDEPPGKAAPRISRAPLTPEKAGHAVSEKARQKTGRRVMRQPALSSTPRLLMLGTQQVLHHFDG
ncbi:MAG: hypothetical protein ACLU5I_09970, partial [Alistipes finegoldii]